MILQYKGFKNNWSFEEAETITYAYINVGDIAMNYRGYANGDIERVRKMHEEIDEYITKETCATNIVYNIGDLPMSEMVNIAVVILLDKGKVTSRVFALDGENNRVFLLNDRGQTVCKIV